MKFNYHLRHDQRYFKMVKTNGESKRSSLDQGKVLGFKNELFALWKQIIDRVIRITREIIKPKTLVKFGYIRFFFSFSN